jgi:hypothetical protein
MLPILTAKTKEWGDVTMQIGAKALENMEEINAACVDYLMYSGYVCYAYFWAKASVVASDAITADATEKDFYASKLYTAQFFYERLLPRTESLRTTMLSGSHNVLNNDINPFI